MHKKPYLDIYYYNTYIFMLIFFDLVLNPTRKSVPTTSYSNIVMSIEIIRLLSLINGNYQLYHSPQNFCVPNYCYELKMHMNIK